ncbi:Hpt domain-containing protein [Leptospira sp. GIMC2001]|uniref:Hpt domain-containing protein n=1 Tax=Leptospira sp. GIMC2001 TaxID=1513297 RepID=UPI00234A179A|nr:Hpt domain-containing protein [Leptospira sp. GIMC2001]WCL48522.1 Hpt domain-containing protein [Leptospira sp. GIMC2001]
MKPSTLAKFQKMKEDYAKALPDKMAEIRKLYDQILEYRNIDSHNADLLQEIYTHIHNLAGSGSSFGFPEIGDWARNFEMIIKNILDRKEILNSDFEGMNDSIQQIDHLLK